MYLALKGDDNYEKIMEILQILKSDFYWWARAIDRSVNRIKGETYDLEIFTNASTTGWGAAGNEETVSGPWSQDERQNAAFCGLKSFARKAFNCQILLKVDNTTAISYINRMGGMQFPHLIRITRELWQWCELRKIFVFVSYINTADNEIADAESRRVHPDIEWEICEEAYQKIVAQFGTPDIDI